VHSYIHCSGSVTLPNVVSGSLVASEFSSESQKHTGSTSFEETSARTGGSHRTLAGNLHVPFEGRNETS